MEHFQFFKQPQTLCSTWNKYAAIVYYQLSVINSNFALCSKSMM